MWTRTDGPIAGIALLLALVLGLASLRAENEPPAGSGNLFDRLARGKAVWVRSEITESHLIGQFDRIAERLGISDGRLTRAQYEDYLAQRRADRLSGKLPPPAKPPLPP